MRFKGFVERMSILESSTFILQFFRKDCSMTILKAQTLKAQGITDFSKCKPVIGLLSLETCNLKVCSHDPILSNPIHF